MHFTPYKRSNQHRKGKRTFITFASLNMYAVDEGHIIRVFSFKMIAEYVLEERGWLRRQL